MKKILIGFASLALSVAAFSGVAAVQASAAVYPEDNYGAYVVAAGEVAGGGGLTAYYTKIGDGNGVMTFDLLSENKFGWFGLICGNVDNINDLTTLKDYALFGKDVKTTLELGELAFGFESGYTYRTTFNATGKTISLEQKEIGATDDEYAAVFEVGATFEKSNVIGMATLSDGLDSSTVIIDNLIITDLKGKTTYVNNTFDGGATVKDGSMKIGSYNATTGATNSVGNVYLHKEMLCTVRFVDESGTLLSQQDVCLYGAAKAPTAPKKEGYDFVGWSEKLVGVRKDMLVYPLYEVRTEQPSDSASAADRESSTSSDSSNENSSALDSASQSGADVAGGCGGVVAQAAGMIGILTAAGVALATKRRTE